MRQRERLVLAVFFFFLVLPLSGAKGSAEGDGGAMARAALPPPLRPAPSDTDWLQPQRTQTQSVRREPSVSKSRLVRSGKANYHPSKNRRGEIAAVDPGTAFSLKPLARLPRYHKRRHLDGANFAARGDKQFDRHPVSGFTRDQEYADPQDASPAMAPVALAPPPFGYIPDPPPGFGYPPVHQPPWLPGPTPPR